MGMGRLLLAGCAVVLGVMVLAATAGFGHPERTTVFGNRHEGAVPTYRTTGPANYVCQPGTKARIKRIFAKQRSVMKRRLGQLKRCKYNSIQDAVNAAKSNYRIELLPGTYTEPKSRAVPVGGYQKEPCPNDYVVTEGFGNNAPPPGGPASNDPPVRPDRNYQVKCPNSKNLIEVVGDPSPEPNPSAPSTPKCTQLCNLQIEGLGKKPTDVVIVGDRLKADVLRIDRADGIYLRNFTIEQGEFNGIDIVEVNGFRVSKIIARYNQNYGVLSFTTVHGLYDNDEAYGNGDSGLYPGSTMKGCDPGADGTCDQGDPGSRKGCADYSVEIRDSYSHDNTLGYSGTAGNSTWVHDNRFVNNNTGLTTDSFASGHPGMPQECFKWENNDIGHNNNNVFAADRQDYCTNTPFEKRKREIVCPQFQSPVGTGVVIGGGNRNLLQGNNIYDNWRSGVYLLSVPATIRGENDPSKQQDTSNGNQVINNKFGIATDGSKQPNGADVVWDSSGQGNCFGGNTSSGRPNTPASLPACPGSPVYMPADLSVLAAAFPCTAWDPKTQHNPPGCDWFTTPAKP